MAPPRKLLALGVRDMVRISDARIDTARFIAGDWGGSRLRLYLCDRSGVVERRFGPGAVGAREPHEQILMSLIQPWLARHGPLPVLLCGMVGSRNGWVEAPYAAAPAGLADLRRLVVRVEARGAPASIAPVLIAPGVCGRNFWGAPEVMRGEETQIMGALTLMPDLAHGRRRLALPGTHTKWTLVEDGRITGFQTALTGEMFALLRDHASLARLGGGGEGGEGGFAAGLESQSRSGQAGLLHQVFEARSRQLIDGWSAAFALEFLSGLLIGADVAGALAQDMGEVDRGEAGVVALVGDPALNRRYGEALARHGVQSRALSGEDCALAGLRAIFQSEGASNVAR